MAKRQTAHPSSLVGSIKHILSLIKTRLNKATARTSAIIQQYPGSSFIALLVILTILIVSGNLLTRPASETMQTSEPKTVSVVPAQTMPKIQVIGTVQKTGVVTIIAQSPGIVSSINGTVGGPVAKNQRILSLSTNYQGGSAQSVGRQIAQANQQLTETNYETQKEMLKLRRELADAQQTQAEDLRRIGRDSLSDTYSLISLNEEILMTIDAQILALEQTNVNGTNDAVILQTKQAKAGLLAGLNQLRSAARSGEYSTSDDNIPADLGSLQRELTLKQLAVEERALELGRNIARLNLNLAWITESLMNPVSPINGTLARVHVTVGQYVNPGTMLATITGDSTSGTITAGLSPNLANRISRLSPTRIIGTDQPMELFPTYIPSEPTDGSLITITYAITGQMLDRLANGSSVRLEIPLAEPETDTDPYLPLDAVYQSQSGASVLVAVPSPDGSYTARERSIRIGNVRGAYVEVFEGVEPNDLIITDRTVIDGESVLIRE